MRALRLSALFVVLAAPAALFAACSSESNSSSSGTGGGSTSTTSTDATTGTGGDPSSTTSATTSTSASTGSSMIECSDGYTNMAVGECDLLQQDCAQGQTCKPKYTGTDWTTICVVSSGLKGPAESCTDDSECKAGLICLNQCLAFCCPDNDQPCGGGACNLQVNWNETEYFTMVCSYAEMCTLFQDMACPEGSECHIEDTTQGLTTCIPPSPTQVEEGENCTFLNDCKDMQFCFAAAQGEQGVCRYNCDTTAPAGTPAGLGGCPAGQTCQPNYNFGIPNVSICLP